MCADDVSDECCVLDRNDEGTYLLGEHRADDAVRLCVWVCVVRAARREIVIVIRLDAHISYLHSGNGTRVRYRQIDSLRYNSKSNVSTHGRRRTRETPSETRQAHARNLQRSQRATNQITPVTGHNTAHTSDYM